MIYFHSDSKIEQALANALSVDNYIIPISLSTFDTLRDLELLLPDNTNVQSVLYSFQDLSHYKHIDSFKYEINKVEIILQFLKQKTDFNFILINYPGAYCNSDNLFLQCKGQLETRIIESVSHCTVLKIQGIHTHDPLIHNLHNLLYLPNTNVYQIPSKQSQVIYSVSLHHLHLTINKVKSLRTVVHFDVFDLILDLHEYLHLFSINIPIQKRTSTYLLLKSYLGLLCAPTMLELFMRKSVPMYNGRTERELQIIYNTSIGTTLHTTDFNYTQPQATYRLAK